MDIRYEKIRKTYNKYIKLDTSIKNILLLGKGNTRNERNNIINPMTVENALEIYGESELYYAYEEAFNISNMSNIYTVNCYTLSDFISIINLIVQYDFNYIVPIGINFSDILYNANTDENQYYSTFILDLLYKTNSLSTLIMTDEHASKFEDIDHFLNTETKVTNDFVNKNIDILELMGSNIIFSLNMLNNIKYSNAVLAAMLSINDSSKYLNYINLFTPVYDIDFNDLPGFCNFVYFKYNYNLNKTNAENLVNFRVKDDIYKKVIIDELIKSILRILDLNEFKGKIYTKYTNLQIKTKIMQLLTPCVNKTIKTYILKNVQFVKTNVNAGYIYIELSITPYDTFEQLNIVMEV